MVDYSKWDTLDDDSDDEAATVVVRDEPAPAGADAEIRRAWPTLDKAQRASVKAFLAENELALAYAKQALERALPRTSTGAGSARAPRGRRRVAPRRARGLRGRRRALQGGSPGVVSFPALTDDFCDALVREVDHYRRSGLPSRNPNSMNQYGLILNDVGMRGTFSAFLKYVLLPVGARLFGDDATYAKGRDTHLDMHIDECDVTFNFGLTDAANFAGNDLTFCGMYYADTHRRRSATYKHARGRCVVHSGKRRHGALDIEDGERASLIMWTKSSSFRATAEYARRNVRALNHSGGTDRICLSWSHDPDYKRLMPKGLQYSMAWRTVCDEAKLKNGQSRRLVLEAENEQVVVFRHRRKLFAIDNRCAHQGGNLCAGDVEDLGTVLRHRTKAPPKSVNACLEDGVVRCPRHGLCFNIRTGEYVDDPDSGTLRQRVFPVRSKDGKIQVQVDVLRKDGDAAAPPPPPAAGSFRDFLKSRA
ncbi:procollagen-lysine 5-dioxygenase [Aureococcus anophagefferens]|nr:procollagen-lysine 5-dioxygenase [Aureococcus anophagefferens]